MKKLVYIFSQGHSGSTLLDMIIGSHSDTFSIGERVTRGTHLDISRPCTCGATNLQNCNFWSKVGGEIETKGHPFDSLEIEALSPAKFQQHNALFYQSISRIAKVSTLIDSAKSIRRLRMLEKTGSQNLKIIFLERSPFGVVASQNRRKRGWLQQTIMHQLNSAAKRHYVKRLPHLYVQYEKLAGNPEAEMTRIMHYIGHDFEPTQLNWTKVNFHLLGGSRMRFDPNPVIRLDARWRNDLSLLQKTVIGLINNKWVDEIMVRIYGVYFRIKSMLSGSE